MISASEKRKPARIHSPDPFLRAGNQSRFCENPYPQKIVFAKPSPILKPRRTARILGGQNPKKKNVLSILEKIHPREKSKKQGTFFLFGVAE